LTEARKENTIGEPSSLLQRIRTLNEEKKLTLLGELVCTQAAAVLRYEGDDAIEMDSVFFEIGFNSLTAVKLRNSLNEVLGLTLPAMLLFDYPTPAALASHLRAQIVDQEHEPTIDASATDGLVRADAD
jgi:acyl carrier protein